MSFLNPLQKLANSLFGSDETNGNNSNSTSSNSNSSAASPIAAPKPKQSFWSSGPGRAVPGSVKQVRGAKYPPLFSPPDSSSDIKSLEDSHDMNGPADTEISSAESSPADASSSSSSALTFASADSSSSSSSSSSSTPTLSLAPADQPADLPAPNQSPTSSSASSSSSASASASTSTSFSSSSLSSAEQNRINKFKRLLSEEKCDLVALRKMSWSGVPSEVRSEVWQLLCGYAPLNRERRDATLERRRAEYAAFVQQYYEVDASTRTETEQGHLRQILLDIPRTHPHHSFFRMPVVQKSLERLLYVWSVRHPACGYVQGMNDLATPFMSVFFAPDCPGFDLNQFGADSLTQAQVFDREADCFWCFSKLMDGIQDNYIFAQPGLQRQIHRLRELVNRIDSSLCSHMESQNMMFIQFAFRWVNNMLMREFSLPLIVRLWDTYLSEEDDDAFSVFHVYVCAALLLSYASKIKEMEFQDLMMFVPNLPTKNWSDKEIETMLAQAFVYKTLYHHSPNHLQ